MKVFYRERALADLEDIVAYLQDRSPTGARKVATSIYAAIAEIAENPTGARRTSDPTVRVKVVSRYGYKIFYSVGADAVEILLCATARDGRGSSRDILEAVPSAPHLHYRPLRFGFGESGRLSLTPIERVLWRSASFKPIGRPCFFNRSANASSASS